MKSILLGLTLICEISAAILVAISIARPRWGIWPPAQRWSWPGFVMWFLFLGSAGGVVALGLVDWRCLSLPLWVRFFLGASLWGVGNLLALWSMAVLGFAPSLGDKGPLVRRGPYRVSRNPQYVGFMLGLVGWAVLSSSVSTLVAAIAGVVALALAPVAEEPWLRERHGSSYEEYERAVPRFFGFVRNRGAVRSPADRCTRR